MAFVISTDAMAFSSSPSSRDALYADNLESSVPLLSKNKFRC
jgi:hypothetical protein